MGTESPTVSRKEGQTKSRSRAQAALSKLLARTQREESKESEISQAQKRRIRRATQRKNQKIRQGKEKQKLWLQGDEERQIAAQRAQANARVLLAWNLASEREIELKEKVLSLSNLNRPNERDQTGEEEEDVWNSKMTRNYPGLTPGLAPVDAEEESESD